MLQYFVRIRAYVSRRGGLVLLLLVLSLCLWAVIIFISLAHIATLAGGLHAFDTRPTGYSFDDAKAFLAALGDRGRQYYLHTQLWLDLFYPLTYAISRIAVLIWLAAENRVKEKALPTALLLFLILLPFLNMLFDWLENMGINRMLTSWPNVSEFLVAYTSYFTVVKSTLSIVSETIVVVLFILFVWRKVFGKKIMAGIAVD